MFQTLMQKISKKQWKKTSKFCKKTELGSLYLCLERVIGSKWVFVIKKARMSTTANIKFLLARRHRLLRKYSISVRNESIMILLSIASKENIKTVNIDLKTAFLYGKLQEEIYLRPPEGYIEKSDILSKLQ